MARKQTLETLLRSMDCRRDCEWSLTPGQELAVIAAAELVRATGVRKVNNAIRRAIRQRPSLSCFFEQWERR
jgi:hypothetical protein